MIDASFIALVALVIFCIIIYKTGAHTKVFAKLDDRSIEIQNDLQESRSLLEEAKTILNEQTVRREQIEQEAKEIILRAEQEAESMTKQAQQRLEKQIEMQRWQAEQQIKTAEQAAVEDIKLAASNLAVNISETIIRNKLSGKAGDNYQHEKSDDIIKHLS